MFLVLYFLPVVFFVLVLHYFINYSLVTYFKIGQVLHYYCVNHVFISPAFIHQDEL